MIFDDDALDWLGRLAVEVHQLASGEEGKRLARFRYMVGNYCAEPLKRSLCSNVDRNRLPVSSIAIPANPDLNLNDDDQFSTYPLRLGPTESLAAKYSVLAAIHDIRLEVVRDRIGAVVPEIFGKSESLENAPFVLLKVKSTPELKLNSHADLIADFLCEVRTDLDSI